MGMSSSQLTRFLKAADATLTELFPGTLVIAGTSYACAAVGAGSAMMEFASDYGGGQAPQGSRFFRISKTLLATRPETGTRVTWSGAGSETALTIMECPDRPHEQSWMLRCEPTNR
jgi:hypothetical protein